MIVGLVLIFSWLLSITTWKVVIYLLKYKYNEQGISLAYHLQARWELYWLETDLRVTQIKARERKAAELTEVEEVQEVEQLPPQQEKVVISLDKEVTAWNVHYSSKKDQYKTTLCLEE